MYQFMQEMSINATFWYTKLPVRTRAPTTTGEMLVGLLRRPPGYLRVASRGWAKPPFTLEESADIAFAQAEDQLATLRRARGDRLGSERAVDTAPGPPGFSAVGLWERFVLLQASEEDRFQPVFWLGYADMLIETVFELSYVNFRQMPDHSKDYDALCTHQRAHALQILYRMVLDRF